MITCRSTKVTPHILKLKVSGQFHFSAFFKVGHPRCVSNKSNYKIYAFIVKHNCVRVCFSAWENGVGSRNTVHHHLHETKISIMSHITEDTLVPPYRITSAISPLGLMT